MRAYLLVCQNRDPNKSNHFLNFYICTFKIPAGAPNYKGALSGAPKEKVENLSFKLLFLACYFNTLKVCLIQICNSLFIGEK